MTDLVVNLGRNPYLHDLVERALRIEREKERGTLRRIVDGGGEPKDGKVAAMEDLEVVIKHLAAEAGRRTK